MTNPTKLTYAKLSKKYWDWRQKGQFAEKPTDLEFAILSYATMLHSEPEKATEEYADLLLDAIKYREALKVAQYDGYNTLSEWMMAEHDRAEKSYQKKLEQQELEIERLSSLLERTASSLGLLGSNWYNIPDHVHSLVDGYAYAKQKLNEYVQDNNRPLEALVRTVLEQLYKNIELVRQYRELQKQPLNEVDDNNLAIKVKSLGNSQYSIQFVRVGKNVLREPLIIKDADFFIDYRMASNDVIDELRRDKTVYYKLVPYGVKKD